MPRFIHNHTAVVESMGLMPGGDTIPAMALNPFTGEYLLGAGGAAGTFQLGTGAAGRTGWMQAGHDFGDDLKAGGGVARWSEVMQDAIGESATAVGSGGGSAASYCQLGRVAASGAGADGAIYIYARCRI